MDYNVHQTGCEQLWRNVREETTTSDRYRMPACSATHNQLISLVLQQLNRSECRIYCDHSVTSAGVRLSVDFDHSDHKNSRGTENENRASLATGQEAATRGAITAPLLSALEDWRYMQPDRRRRLIIPN
jgi:hypothetical protein